MAVHAARTRRTTTLSMSMLWRSWPRRPLPGATADPADPDDTREGLSRSPLRLTRTPARAPGPRLGQNVPRGAIGDDSPVGQGHHAVRVEFAAWFRSWRAMTTEPKSRSSRRTSCGDSGHDVGANQKARSGDRARGKRANTSLAWQFINQVNDSNHEHELDEMVAWRLVWPLSQYGKVTSSGTRPIEAQCPYAYRRVGMARMPS